MTTYKQNNLRKFRRLCNLRQQDVADKLGIIAFDRISRWERGFSYPGVENLVKLARLYNARLVDLYPELFAEVEVTATPGHAQRYNEEYLATAQDVVFE